MLRLIKMRVWNRIWYGVILDCYYDTMIMGLKFIYVDGVFDLGNESAWKP